MNLKSSQKHKLNCMNRSLLN